jgi:geranylgeranyl diphosphate synthase type 3
MEKLSEEEAKILEEPYRYLLEVPGKGIRAHFIKAFNTWLQIDEDRLKNITEIIDMLHTASLLIDDIEDNSKLRRGVPVAHLIHGVPATINCANYIYFVALQRCSQLGNPEATNIFIEELINLHKGQGFDIYWRDNGSCPTEEQYKTMVIHKTGGLFRLAVRLMQAFSANQTNFVPLVNALGLLFQIRDDYMNLQSQQYMDNKSFCEDLTEGKFSFPIIHSIRSNPTDSRLLKILKQKTEDIDIKKYARTIMETTGSFEYTRQAIKECEAQVRGMLQELPANATLLSTVAALATLQDKM